MFNLTVYESNYMRFKVLFFFKLFLTKLSFFKKKLNNVSTKTGCGYTKIKCMYRTLNKRSPLKNNNIFIGLVRLYYINNINNNFNLSLKKSVTVQRKKRFRYRRKSFLVQKLFKFKTPLSKKIITLLYKVNTTHPSSNENLCLLNIRSRKTYNWFFTI